MTTRLHHHDPAESTFAPYGHIEADQDLVRVGTSNGLFTGGTVTVDRAEFLRAVETELNVIVINRADLPTVIDSRDEKELLAGPIALHLEGDEFANPDGCRKVAAAYLALAEHLEAHPPVDEAQVDALTVAIESAVDRDGVSLQESHPRALAHYLVQAGVRPPKAD